MAGSLYRLLILEKWQSLSNDQSLIGLNPKLGFNNMRALTDLEFDKKPGDLAESTTPISLIFIKANRNLYPCQATIMLAAFKPRGFDKSVSFNVLLYKKVFNCT